MKRREFIVKSGTVITAAAFAGVFGGAAQVMAQSNQASGSIMNKPKRPDPNDFGQPILKAIALGINAPSPHNIQSWKFKIMDDHSMYLYVDENMLLPATDPPSRQIHIGAGCFIETLVIGSTSLGYTALVTYFPEGYELASDFGSKPVAKINLQKKGIKKDELSDYISTRHTNRKEYKGPIISVDEFEALKQLSGESHAQLIFINKGFEPYFELLKRAFEIESRTYRTNEETRILFRFSEKERAAKGDGLSIPQMGFGGIMKFFAESSLDQGNKEKWHGERAIRQSLKSIFRGIESSRGIVFWVTEHNTFEDWVKTGRDFVRFGLALTKQGLYAHPYAQPTQEYEEMDAVLNELNEVMGIKEPQKVQMIVRIGRCSPSYVSYRRNFESYLMP